VKWFKRQHKKTASPEALALLLLKLSEDIVEDANQTLEKYLGDQQRSQLVKAENELAFFSWFALDYWIQKGPARTQEEQCVLRQAFHAHLANIVSLDTLQERFNAYGRIVNETKGDNAIFVDFGIKLSEFCDMPDTPFLTLAPRLFTQALESLATLESVQSKFK
jgi:hypothetical protein